MNTFKRTRRGQKKKPKDITIYYCNINGFKSKQDSLRKIVDNLQPKIIVLCETKLSCGSLLKKVLPEYEICPRATKAGKGGIAIAVKLQTFSSVIDVTNSLNKNILTVRIKMATTTIRVIAGYAPQETDLIETRQLFFSELEAEILKSKLENEPPLIIGDMNCKTEMIDDQIVGTSANGKLLCSLVENQDLDVLNYSSKCEGVSTHVVRTTGDSSVLDYCVVDKEITKAVVDVTIDEACVYCPFRILKKNGCNEPKYSDHNAIIVRLKIEHEKKPTQKEKGWKITDEGLKKFELDTAVLTLEDENLLAQAQYDKLEEKIHAAMDSCFRKMKSSKKDRILSNHHLKKYKQVTAFSRKGKSQRRVAKMYIKEILKANTEETSIFRKDKMVETLKNLTIDNKFTPDKFWKLCKKSKKTKMGGASVEGRDGKELFGEDLIRNAYRDEFEHRLRQRTIIPELKNYEERTKLLCALYLEQTRHNHEPDYTREELNSVYGGVKKGKSPGRDKVPPEVYTNGGQGLQTAVLDTLNKIKCAESIPRQWEKITMPTIYKNKGKVKQLVNHRGIFLKQVLSKMFEKLNTIRINPYLEKISKFQAGARCKRGPADQTFLLRGQIDHSLYIGKPLFATLYDFEQCFDSLWLEDCLLSLRKLGIESEVLNIISNLNKSCDIVVKTPVGPTEEFTVKSIVQQGSVCGGILCTAATGEVDDEVEVGGCQIGGLNIRALIFVDDIAATNTSTRHAYYSHDRIVWFSKKKRLTLNAKKCMLLCINGKPDDVVPRLKIGRIVVDAKRCVTYLGEQFNERGDNKDLIEERRKKGMTCLVTSLSMCNEVTMGFFTIQTMLILHESLFLAVVLYNCQAWSNLTKSDIDTLTTTQLKFLKRIFHAPSSTPNALTFLETGTLPIEYEIHKRQLSFLHHVLSMQNDDPVRVMYKEQLKFEYEKNWSNGVKALRQKYDIDENDAEIANMSKETWKESIKKKIYKTALETLNKELATLKQSKFIPAYDCLKPQEYIYSVPPAQARNAFHIRTGIVDVKEVRKYKYQDVECRLCGENGENIEHIVNKCELITKTYNIDNIYSPEVENVEEVVRRYRDFLCLIEKM